MRRVFQDLSRGFDPVELFHRDIHDGDVRLMLARSLHGFDAGAGLGDDIEIGAAV
jgi:hypothetical protein